VNPVPEVTASPLAESFCPGGTTAITLSSLTPGTTFTWTAALTSGTAIGFADGTGSSIAQTLTNATADPATVTYTITPSANGCTGLPVDVVVTVNPSP
jgi:large repetitive protein